MSCFRVVVDTYHFVIHAGLAVVGEVLVGVIDPECRLAKYFFIFIIVICFVDAAGSFLAGGGGIVIKA